MAGKALKDVKEINSCPGCGRPKKAHFLCPFCVAGKEQFRGLTDIMLTNAAEIKESWVDKQIDKGLYGK